MWVIFDDGQLAGEVREIPDDYQEFRVDVLDQESIRLALHGRSDVRDLRASVIVYVKTERNVAIIPPLSDRPEYVNAVVFSMKNVE
jgi:hypothetical protein